jgi:hypothetical protein
VTRSAVRIRRRLDPPARKPEPASAGGSHDPNNAIFPASPPDVPLSAQSNQPQCLRSARYKYCPPPTALRPALFSPVALSLALSLSVGATARLSHRCSRRARRSSMAPSRAGAVHVAVALLAVVATVAVHAAGGGGGGRKMASHGEVSPRDRICILLVDCHPAVQRRCMCYATMR